MRPSQTAEGSSNRHQTFFQPAPARSAEDTDPDCPTRAEIAAFEVTWIRPRRPAPIPNLHLSCPGGELSCPGGGSGALISSHLAAGFSWGLHSITSCLGSLAKLLLMLDLHSRLSLISKTLSGDTLRNCVRSVVYMSIYDTAYSLYCLSN